MQCPSFEDVSSFMHFCAIILKVQQETSSHSEGYHMSCYRLLLIRITYLKINVFPNTSVDCNVSFFSFFFFVTVLTNCWWYLCWWNPSLGVTFPHTGIIHPSIKRFVWVIMMHTITLSCSSSPSAVLFP